MKIKDLYWAAGFLEGEGAFLYRNHNLGIFSAQVQKHPLIKLNDIIPGHISKPFQSKNPNHSPIYTWFLSGPKAAGAMMSLFPLMSPKRQQQIKKALTAWRKTKSPTSNSKTCIHGHPKTPHTYYRDPSGEMCCRLCTKKRNRLRLTRAVKKNWVPTTDQLNLL